MEKTLAETAKIRDLTHEMNNSLAYVVTNLSLLAEELDDASPRQRGLVEDALEGSERIGELIRTLRRMTWGTQPSNPAPTSEAVDAERARILVIDDEEAILTAVSRALRSHDVTVTSSAADALAAVGKTPFDLVLCDLMMPAVNGMELFQQLRNRHPKTAERVVFMTAGGFTAEARAFLSNIDNGVLHKPFDVKTLRWVVSQKLREHQ